jgi:hypothetical protein
MWTRRLSMDVGIWTFPEFVSTKTERFWNKKKPQSTKYPRPRWGCVYGVIYFIRGDGAVETAQFCRRMPCTVQKLYPLPVLTKPRLLSGTLGLHILWISPMRPDLTVEQRRHGTGASLESAKQWLHRSASAADSSTAAAGLSHPSKSPTWGTSRWIVLILLMLSYEIFSL